MTYLRAKHWWMRPFERFAQCQSKSIYGQFETGCRYFDLRIRFNGDKPVFAHGLIEYEGECPEYVIAWLNRKSCIIHETIYLRILLETPWENKKQEEKFKEFISNLSFPYIKIWVGYKNPWMTISKTFDKEFVEVAEWINSVKKFLRTPKWYAEHTQEEKIKAIENTDVIVGMDFV